MGMSARSDRGIEVSMAGQAKLFAILLQDEHVGESVAVMARLAILLFHRLMLEFGIKAGFRFLVTRVARLFFGETRATKLKNEESGNDAKQPLRCASTQSPHTYTFPLPDMCPATETR
jgi:hypothetical protein